MNNSKNVRNSVIGDLETESILLSKETAIKRIASLVHHGSHPTHYQFDLEAGVPMLRNIIDECLKSWIEGVTEEPNVVCKGYSRKDFSEDESAYIPCSTIEVKEFVLNTRQDYSVIGLGKRFKNALKAGLNFTLLNEIYSEALWRNSDKVAAYSSSGQLNILVINDQNSLRSMGIRDETGLRLANLFKSQNYVIWICREPFLQGRLWDAFESLTPENKSKIIFIAREQELRKNGVRISKYGSIERSLRQLSDIVPESASRITFSIKETEFSFI